MKKILIVEDEPRAANQLIKVLDQIGFEYDLIDILDSVEESRNWFTENSAPDLIFMDIQLADGISFEIFQDIEIDCPIVFTTAFDQYAIQAFKVNSVDYLLKPIQKEDLRIAIQKFEKSLDKAGNNIDSEVLIQLMQSVQPSHKRSGILVKDGAGFVQLNINELLYLYSEDGITFGVTKNKRYIIDETLDQVNSTLDQNVFFKINRGQIVSRMALVKLEPYFNHRVKLLVDNARDQEFVVSRQKTSDFKKWLNS